MHLTALSLSVVVALGAGGPVAWASTGDPDEGERLYRTCAACHSLAPGDHRTGPSLAGMVGREAGTVEDFQRYSPALEAAEVTWDAETLDAWLADPAALIPGNRMNFRGIPDPQARADLIAFLEQAGGEAPPRDDRDMADTGMTAGSELLDLDEETGANNRVTAIRYCGDTYTVEVESGDAHPFWEFNLRFKTDSSERGPAPERPVLIPAGMMGDRAFVVFAAPSEMASFIEMKC